MGRVFSLVFCLSLWRKSIEDGTLIYQKMFCPMRRGNMLKVLIADDEEKICQLIIKLINWEEMGLKIAATASKWY